MSRTLEVRFVKHKREPGEVRTYSIKDLPPEEQQRISGLFRVIKPKKKGRLG